MRKGQSIGQRQCHGRTLRYLAWLLLPVILVAGCSRKHYRCRADRDSYSILQEKSCGREWHVPCDFTIDPDPSSRLYHAQDPNDPDLPCPAPQLYAYQLPPGIGTAHGTETADEIAARLADAIAPESDEPQLAADPDGAGEDDGKHAIIEIREVPLVLGAPQAVPQAPSISADSNHQPIAQDRHDPALPPVPDTQLAMGRSQVTCGYLDINGPAEQPSGSPSTDAPARPPEPVPAGLEDADRQFAAQDTQAFEIAAGLPLLPIPDAFWKAIPSSSLSRMLEFPSVREEYRREYKADPSEELLDLSPRLTLKEIIRVGTLNSRAYQREKELLYVAALALTLQRYDYACKFSTTNNGTDVDFQHDRATFFDANNVSVPYTENTLSVPSQLQGDKLLSTGGALLARFANDVVLTFNGPQGFAESISSELFFDLSQTVFQRDILLEPLVQSERDVVYAARRYARYRKEFFFSAASDYYELLRTYRQIEIEALNYFSLVRALNQAESEEQTGITSAPSRIEVEQIEQKMLDGRSRLISACTDVDRDLDQLKLSLGLPTEMPFNVDLTELLQITGSDGVAVAAEQVRRARRRLLGRSQTEAPDRSDVLNASIVLAERLLEWLRARQDLDQQIPETEPLRQLHARIRVTGARLEMDMDRAELVKARRLVPPAPPIQIFQRIMDLNDALLALAGWQIGLAKSLAVEQDAIVRLNTNRLRLSERTEQLKGQFEKLLKETRPEGVEELLSDAEQLLASIDRQVITADQLTGTDHRPAADEELRQILDWAKRLATDAGQWLDEAAAGLVTVAALPDDAMMIALFERLDLMNERGELADDWRAIKLTADDLKSVLNLRAQHTVRTRSSFNQPFAFTFDDSTTELRLALDLPLNRRSQRNSFRRALIGYQLGLRNLAELEDEIKFDVRERLRRLSLTSAQYDIQVASAALAAERVLSTQLTLQLGFPGVAARDFLEAQDDYRQAVSGVATNHLGYVVSRAQFFLDLERMQLDESGYWPEIDEEDYQVEPGIRVPPDPPYGTIPKFLKVSKRIRRMFAGEGKADKAACTKCGGPK